MRERLVCAHSAPVSSGNSDVMISEGGPLRYVRRVALSWMWLETHIIRVSYLTLSCKDALGKWQSVTWASTSWTPARAQLCWSHISDLQLHYASCLHKLTLTMTFTQPRVIWWMNFNWEYPVGWRSWLLIDLGGLSIPWASLSLGRWAWPYKKARYAWICKQASNQHSSLVSASNFLLEFLPWPLSDEPWPRSVSQ